MSRIYPVPVDSNGRRLLDLCGDVPYTKRWLAVDSTTGVEISFLVDIKSLTLYADSNASFTFTGAGAYAGAAIPMDAAAVTDEGGGLVGLPSTGHPFDAGQGIVVAGTTNYDARYTVNAATSANSIVVAATYVAETLAVTDTATRVDFEHAVPITSPFTMAICIPAGTVIGTAKASSGTVNLNAIVGR